MGVFNPKEVRQKRTQWDDSSGPYPLSPSGDSYYKESCPDDLQRHFNGCCSDFKGDLCSGESTISYEPAYTGASISGEPCSSLKKLDHQAVRG